MEEDGDIAGGTDNVGGLGLWETELAKLRFLRDVLLMLLEMKVTEPELIMVESVICIVDKLEEEENVHCQITMGSLLHDGLVLLLCVIYVYATD